MVTSTRAVNELPGLGHWLGYNLFGAFYPSFISLVCALAATSGFSDVQLVRTAIGQVPFFEVLPVVGFSLLLAVAGDLIFAGRNPGYGKIILMIVVGALLTPMVGIAAYLEMQERVTGVQTADSGYWAALEVVTLFICLLIVASLKSTMFAQEILERTLAEAGIAQDNHG